MYKHAGIKKVVEKIRNYYNGRHLIKLMDINR